MTTPTLRMVCPFLALAALAGACGSNLDAPGATAGLGATTGTGGSAATGGGNGSGLPCDVAEALATACGDCHSNPPNGGPMPLTTFADVHAPSVSDSSRKVYELMLERVQSEDDPMPPSGKMDDADQAVLVAWLAAGAPESKDSCETGAGGSGGGGAVGPDALPCEPTHVITAHAPFSEEKYHVPEVGAENQYECFTFKSPFDGKTQATAWAPIIDDERVLHHWILYRTYVPQIDGGVGPCAMPLDSTFVAGWAPGGENNVMPENVGLELGGPAEYFIMQVHYHNTAHHADSFDASGVAFCTTDTPREYAAGVLTLGTAAIVIPPHAKGWETTGNCPSVATSTLPEPLYLMSSFPHMHELGREFRTDIMRGGSASDVEPLIHIDKFDFADQGFYPHDPPVVLNPGDALKTTCVYDNPNPNVVNFGEKTEDEMCFNFVVAYPIDKLTVAQRTCMF